MIKVLLTKVSDWNFKKVIEINSILDLKNIYSNFIIDFDVEDYQELKIDFIAQLYDDYVE